MMRQHRAMEMENLCAYFVLPLIKLGKVDFIESNVIEVYMTRDGAHVVVQVAVEYLSPRKVFKAPEFVRVLKAKIGVYIVYRIPKRWSSDVQKFMEGKYSKMCLEAKKRIKLYSGLPFQEMRDGAQITDGRLLALYKDGVLRRSIEQELLVNIDDDNELLSIPPDKSFIELDI